MRRDRLTFAMMVGMPIMQLVLFGFAINTDPQAPADRRWCSPTTANSRAAWCARWRTRGYFRIVAAAARARPRPTACWRAARCSSCW